MADQPENTARKLGNETTEVLEGIRVYVDEVYSTPIGEGVQPAFMTAAYELARRVTELDCLLCKGAAFPDDWLAGEPATRAVTPAPEPGSLFESRPVGNEPAHGAASKEPAAEEAPVAESERKRRSLWHRRRQRAEPPQQVTTASTDHEQMTMGELIARLQRE